MHDPLGLFRWRAATIISITGLFLGIRASTASAAQSRTFTFDDVQVTATAAGVADELTLDAFGSSISFVSTANITGSNPDGNPEIYVADVFFGFAITPRQITNTPAGVMNAHPKLNADGGMLFFQSTGNLDPAIGNADGSTETFSIDLATPGAIFKQLTVDQAGAAALTSPNPANRVSSASSNSDGSIIVFASRSSRIPGTNNPDSNSEIFMYDRIDDVYYQLTNTSGSASNLHPVIDDGGTVVAYLSNQDGNYEVHVVEVTENTVDVDPCVADPASCANNPPVITITPAGSQSVNENETLTLHVTVSDLDQDYVSLKVVQADGSPLPLGAKISLDAASCDPEFDNCACNPAVTFCAMPSDLKATFTWKPNGTQGGRDYQLLFKATDEFDDTSEVSQLVNITVVNANQPPTLPANLGIRTVRSGMAMLPIGFNASDADCDTLAAGVDGLPSGAVATDPVFTPCPATPAAGASSKISGQITWTPQPGQEGVYTINVNVSDGNTVVTGVATITVVANRPPVITTGDASVYERGCLMVVIRGQDPDGDPLEIDVDPSTLPTGALFYRGTGLLHYHPDTSVATPAAAAKFTVRAKVTDGVATVEKDLRITVFDTPDDQAVFFTPSLGISAAPGAAVTASLIVKNSGYSTWGPGYALVPDFVGTGMTTPATVALPVASVIPGSYATFTVPMSAPVKLGSYTVRFKMANNGQKFGAASGSVIVTVK